MEINAKEKCPLEINDLLEYIQNLASSFSKAFFHSLPRQCNNVYCLWSNVSVSVSISFLACNSTQFYEGVCCVPFYATLHYLPTVDAHC